MGGMQIKTTVGYHILVRLAVFKKTRNKWWWGCGGKGTLVHCWMECNLVQPLWKTVAAAAAKSLQSCLTLCDPIDGSPPGSPVPGILQVRTLEWVAISFSNAWKWKVKVKSQSCPTLSNPMDCSLPGSSVHGIFQAVEGPQKKLKIELLYMIQQFH